MDNYDELVFNEKRSQDGSLTCYNCRELYWPSAGQGVTTISRRLNPRNKEFCDVECMLAYARDFMFDDDFLRYHQALNNEMGRYVVYIGDNSAMKSMGGSLTREEYKRRASAVEYTPNIPNEPNKRHQMCLDDDFDDAEMVDV